MHLVDKALRVLGTGELLFKVRQAKAGVDALAEDAAQVLLALHDGHARSGLMRGQRGRHAGGAAADNDHVKDLRLYGFCLLYTSKGIKVRNTPELTDELVKSDFGFDSIDAMRDAIKLEIEQDKASRLPAEKENRCVSALAERLQLDEMDADYEQSVFEELGQNFLSNLAARGMTLDTWLPASGLTMEQFIGDLHKQANDVAQMCIRDRV